MTAETTPSDTRPNEEQLRQFRNLIEKITGPVPPKPERSESIGNLPPGFFDVNEVRGKIGLNRHSHSPVRLEARLARTSYDLHTPMLVGGDAVIVIDKFQSFVAFSNNEQGGITRMRGEKGQGITASSVQRELTPEEIDEVLVFLENPTGKTELVDRFLAMTEGEAARLEAELVEARASLASYHLAVEGIQRARRAFFEQDDGTLIA